MPPVGELGLLAVDLGPPERPPGGPIRGVRLDLTRRGCRTEDVVDTLRSYLWAYPAGIDWFLAVHDASGSLLSEVLHAAYQRPLVPRELEELWPAGPRIGGDA